MSQAQKIREFLAKQPTKEDLDYIPIDLNEVANAVGSTRAKVASHIAAMANIGRLEAVHGTPPPTGGRPPIVGFRNLDMKGKAKSGSRPRLVPVPSGPRPTRRLVQTPELDLLLEARTAMQNFVAQFEGMVDEARAREAIRVDPAKAEAYVNEGLSVIERNMYLEQSNRELRDRVNSLERELGYKKLQRDKTLREALVNSGVAHSDPND